MRILFFIIAATLSAQTPLEKSLDPKRVSALGLHKLSAEEQAEWVKLLNRISARKEADSSASKYLEAQGWERVTYHGEKKSNFQSYSIFSFGLSQRTCAVKTPLFLLLLPGDCWAKVSPLGDGLDSVIMTDGKEHRFFLDEWIEL
ncbi:MAG: hypothetical protein IPK32_13950 [Verrucomicrobiaceae bacterium]|nr:hypothetical protein [Verrucomicrobiaceae bacterium]